MTTYDVEARIRRLENLASGLDAEIVSVATGKTALTKDECHNYREGLVTMAHGARAALGGLLAARDRLRREAGR